MDKMVNGINNIYRRVATQGQDENAPPAPKRSYQIATQMEALGKEVAAQRDLIDRLTVRLQPILPQGYSGNALVAGMSVSVKAATCPLASSISDLGEAVAQNSAMIDALLSDIEV